MLNQRIGLMALSLAVLTTVATSHEALAFPLTSTHAWSGRAAVGMLAEDGFHTPGIAALSNCSASFVKFKNASVDDAGLLLTNGHCSGGSFGSMPRPGEVIYQKPRNFQVRLLNMQGDDIATLQADKIIYATMTDTDVALLHLTQTYRQIEAATGVRPLVVSDMKPSTGTAIEVASGYWDRTYSCAIEAFVPKLQEAGWTFKDSIRYSPNGCEVVGGTSGSPIWNPATGEVIGINNTGNEDGESCTLNNPCEVDPDGQTHIFQGRGYGQETYLFYGCLDEHQQLDFTRTTCQLPKPH